jgi:hypothetical protein
MRLTHKFPNGFQTRKFPMKSGSPLLTLTQLGGTFLKMVRARSLTVQPMTIVWARKERSSMQSICIEST